MRKDKLMRGRSLLVLSVILALVIAVAGCAKEATPRPAATPKPAPTVAAEPTYKLRFAQYTPVTDEPRWTASLTFAELVKQKTNGLVEIEIAPAGQLVPVAQTADALTKGTIDGAFHPDLYLSGLVGALQWDFVTGISKLKTTNKQARESGILELENQALQEHNIVLLGGYSPDEVNVIVHKSKHFERPEELKGEMLRSPGGLLSPVFKDLGAGLASMPSAEVYTAVQRGTVEGAISAVSAMHGLKIEEVAKYWTYVPFGVYRVLFVFNKDTWNSLPADVQAHIVAATIEAEEQAAEDIQEFQKVLFGRVEEKGGIIFRADLDIWLPVLGPLTKKYFLEQAGPTVGEQFIALAEKWNAEHR